MDVANFSEKMCEFVIFVCEIICMNAINILSVFVFKVRIDCSFVVEVSCAGLL